MKLAAASLFVGSLLLGIVVSAASGVNPHSSCLATHPGFWADGGAPVPPILPGGSVTLADGGAPVPPILPGPSVA